MLGTIMALEEDLSQEVTRVDMGEHFCLKWNNHQENLTGIMAKLLEEQKFIDVSIVCEMKTFKAHQTVLSACSPYFQQVLEENPHPHPIVILRDVKECEMSALLQYMYRGEVNVRDHELSAFLNTARALQVRGLSDSKREDTLINKAELTPEPSSSPQSVTPTLCLQKRKSMSGNFNEPPCKRVSSDYEKSPSPLPIICKTTQTGKSSSGVSTSSFSDNFSEPLSAENLTTSAPTPIKQELDGVSALNEQQLQGLTQQLVRVRGAFSAIPASDGEHVHSIKCFESDPRTLHQVELNSVSKSIASDINYRNVKDLYYQLQCTGEKIYMCKMCGTLIKHMRNHYLKHFPEHHVCQMCQRSYTRKDNLNSHLKRDHLLLGKATPRKPPYPRIQKRSSKKTEKCFSPVLYSHMGYRDAAPHMTPLPMPIAMPGHGHGGPMDLSVRPSPTPMHPHPSQLQFGPIYDFLPSFYNYLKP